MSDTMDVQFNEGSTAVSLAELDGQRVERGVPVTVPREIGEQLVKQGWEEVGGSTSKPSPQAASSPQSASSPGSGAGSKSQPASGPTKGDE